MAGHERLSFTQRLSGDRHTAEILGSRLQRSAPVDQVHLRGRDTDHERAPVHDADQLQVYQPGVLLCAPQVARGTGGVCGGS